MQEQDIFKHYELKNWEPSPRIYKILAGSAIINILFFFALAQVDVLTARSCDTPVMSSVCSVVDALYVGSSILDTETGYVNEDYVKTELEDADVTFIDLSGQTPPLEYPAGYFAVANPEQNSTELVSLNSEFPSNTNPTSPNYIPGITGNTKNPTIKNYPTTTDLSKTKPIKPKKNNKTVDGVLPTGVLDNNPTVSQDQTTKTTDKQTNKDQTTAKTDTKDTTEKDPVQSQTVTEANINKKVLKDYATYVKAKVDKKEVDLNEPFKVVVEGVLTKDGKFDISVDKKTKKAKTQFTQWEGSDQIVDVAKKALESIGDSGWMIYLRNQGVENFKITLIQDGEKLFARVESSAKDENSAKTMASGLNGIIKFAKISGKLEDDAKILIERMQPPTSNGNICIIDFVIPKAEAQAMIDRNLKKVETPTSNTINQSNPTAQTNSDKQKMAK